MRRQFRVSLLCCVEFSAPRKGDAVRGKSRGEELRCYSVLLLQPLTATEWWQAGVDHQCSFSLSLFPSSLSLFGSLPGSLTFRLAHSHSALAFDSTHPPPPLLFSLVRHSQNIDNCNVLPQFTAEINNYLKSLHLLPVCSAATYLYVCLYL